MSVTTTSIGPNSWELDYTTGTTQAEIMSAVTTVLTTPAAGWTLFDSAAGTNAICYSSLNKDGESSKYAVLDYTSNVIYVKSYESWNASTHTGTNLAFNSDNSLYSGKYTTTAPGQIFIFASPRWLAMVTRDPATGQLNNNSAWQGLFGLFEVARDNPEDTAVAGYPPVVWLNSHFLFSNPTQQCCGYMPRTRSGATGNTAIVEIGTLLGKTRSASSVKLNMFVPSTTNVWNNKDWSLTLYSHEPSNVVRGRIYGLKAFTYNKNLFLDKASVTVDSDFFFDKTGLAKDHYIIISGTYGAGTAQGRVIVPA